MPSGRDSFRRNRVAPSVRVYFSTLVERLGPPCAALSLKLSVEFLLAGRVWGTRRVFVSVASKGFSLGVSLLFATLAGRSIGVAAKGVKAGKVPPPALFLKRYDSEGVRGWGSVNDMIPWDLRSNHVATFERWYARTLERRDRRGWASANTGENSTPY